MTNVLQVAVLAVVQGLAELLPVSSSAHVIIAEKLMRLDPGSPEMTLLLVMLHTGTMFAVIVYFWRKWRATLFPSLAVFKVQATRLIVATALTVAIGYPLIKVVEKVAEKAGLVPRGPDGQYVEVEIEHLFGNLALVAAALAAAGALIVVAGLREAAVKQRREIGMREAAAIGIIQAFCLPFRGFSRSGATISAGMLAGAIKSRVEEFSFALAVILTPLVIGREVLRLLKDRGAEGTGTGITLADFGPSLLGMALAFLAGLVALRWLSGWLESGRWYWFGVYCLAMSVVALVLHLNGF
jgi:undecaprenyl-diphosphatase